MENTAKLIFEGKEYEFPIVVGTENEKAINIEINAGKLRNLIQIKKEIRVIIMF